MTQRNEIEESLSALQNILIDLDDRFDKATTHEGINEYISRLSLLALCGWVEEAFDKIARKCVEGKLKKNSEEKFNKIVKKNHGFKYENFKKMLMPFIGILKMEEWERVLENTEELKMDNKSNFYKFRSELSILTENRNEVAHTMGYIPKAYPPSVLFKSLDNTILPYIRELYSFAESYNSSLRI